MLPEQQDKSDKLMGESKENKWYGKVLKFFKTDLWQTSTAQMSPQKTRLYNILKKLYLAIKFFTTKGVTSAASSLTYRTLLATVPFFAVIFAIARGFGFSTHIEKWFRNALESQPQAADTVINFVNSYLVHTKSGVILGIGLLFMLYTIIMLTRNIEQVFNDIWQINTSRSLSRSLSDYLAGFFLLPIFIVLSSGLSLYMATIANDTSSYLLLGSAMRFLIRLMPYVLTSLAFIALYVFFPNTNVRLSSTIVPGILAGVAMQLLQEVYFKGQIFLSSYNAIYGSFAALPLFMLWVQLSWSICLFGAELSYTNQNLEEFSFLAHTDDLSTRYRLLLSGILMGHICRQFRTDGSLSSAVQLRQVTGIPKRITQDLLNKLTNAGLLNEVTPTNAKSAQVYQPALPLDMISVGEIVDRLESYGKWDVEVDIRDIKQQIKNNKGLAEAIGIRQQQLSQLRQMPIDSFEDTI